MSDPINKKQIKNNLPSEEFMKIYLEKSIALPAKPDKKAVQKEIINKNRFRTQICNDASYLIILEAEKSIDRKHGINELQKYLGEPYLAHEMEKGLFEYAVTHITINKQQNYLISNVIHFFNSKIKSLNSFFL
jgi:hypothetical protein